MFGVGPKTAEKWYRKGLRSLEQIASDSSIHLNKMQIAGSTFTVIITSNKNRYIVNAGISGLDKFMLNLFVS